MDWSLKWQHHPRLTYSKGKVRVACVCGEQSKKGVSYSEASEWYVTHVNLVEKRGY